MGRDVYTAQEVKNYSEICSQVLTSVKRAKYDALGRNGIAQVAPEIIRQYGGGLDGLTNFERTAQTVPTEFRTVSFIERLTLLTEEVNLEWHKYNLDCMGM